MTVAQALIVARLAKSCHGTVVIDPDGDGQRRRVPRRSTQRLGG
jgi:hypothetical protein